MSTYVGLDPNATGRVVGLLGRAEADLETAGRRVSLLLDAAGFTSSLPPTIRGVARTCGSIATDLDRRRIEIVHSSVGGSPRRPPWFTVSSGLAGGMAPGCDRRPAPPVFVPGPGAGGLVMSTTIGSGGCASAGAPETFPIQPVGPVQDQIGANRKKKPQRWWSEQELQGGSETLTEAEKQAVRDKQAGRPYKDDLYDSAKLKLIKSEKVRDTRNAGKQRGQPRRR